MIKIKIALLAGIFFCACTSGSKLHSTKIEPSGEEILYGKIDRELLFSKFPDWQLEYQNYNPNSMIIDSLKSLSTEFSIEIFMGTWCRDSQREVPRLYKIIDQCNSKPFSDVKIWAVDRNKKLPDSDLTNDRDIHFVATFIITKNNIEIGRIVEQPYDMLESDILDIIKQNMM